MKKFRILIALALCAACSIKAQEVQPQVPEGIQAKDIKDIKDINELKQSEQYVYGEVIEVLTDENENVSLAQQKSIAKMQTHVIEIFGERLKMEKKDVQEIWDVIDDKCQNVVIKKGDLLRVLSYIAKDAIFGTKTKKPGEIDEWFPARPDTTSSGGATTILPDTTNVATQPAKADSTIIAQPTDPKTPADTIGKTVPPVIVTYSLTLNATEGGRVNGAGKYKEGTTVTIEALPAEGYNFTGWATLAGDTLSNAQRYDYTMGSKETTLTACFVKKPAPAPVVEVPALCETLMAQKTYARLMSFLKAEKSQQKLMYGNFDTMQYPEKCYVVIVDKATRVITAVLDKGETDRMNFVTKKNDRYTNYRGGNYAIIFIQEY